MNESDFVRALEFLDIHGDRISQLGAIEVGFRLLPVIPAIESVLIRLIKHLRDDDINGKASGFKLLSALFILVDGELSRTRLFPSEPPFYRRLAALSQASLIHRQIVNLNVDIDVFCDWAFGNRGRLYYLQTLTDMRLEPRWSPDFAEAVQIKADFLGRIVLAAKNFEKSFMDGELRNLVFGTEPGSILSHITFPNSYFPGPLEGVEDTVNVLPSEFSEKIETQLGKGVVDPSSFIALVNSAPLFRVDSAQVELASTALKLGNYRLQNVKDKSQLLAILNGLATVAAVTRNCMLANELRILVRRYNCDAQYSLSIGEATRICLIAAASRDDLYDWREFAGDWLTELAFGGLKDDDGELFHTDLLYLCHALPELWISCGRADAALMAFNAKRHF